jgi:hypothetical protein
MGSSELGTTAGEAVASQVPTTTPSAPGERRRPAWQVWIIALAAGIAAGLVAGLAGELTHGYFRPRLYQVEVMGLGTTMQPSRESLFAADLYNATLTFAVLGCATGLAMGFAGGLAGGSPARGVVVGLAAQAAGALVGALASLALVPLFFRRLVPDVNDLLTPILIHGGIWMAIGVVGGLAFAIGLNFRRHLANALGAACIGAFLAAVLYHLLSGSLFPDSGSTAPLAGSSVVRLLAMFLVTVLVAIGAVRGALGRAPRPSLPVPGP